LSQLPPTGAGRVASTTDGGTGGVGARGWAEGGGEGAGTALEDETAAGAGSERAQATMASGRKLTQNARIDAGIPPFLAHLSKKRRRSKLTDALRHGNSTAW